MFRQTAAGAALDAPVAIGQSRLAQFRKAPAERHMKDERLIIKVDPDYASALGLAVYCFASLEWNAVRCCEWIEPGSIEALEDRTAGRVADTLVHLVKRIRSNEEQLELENAAADFRFLVGTRNNLVHAKPGSAPGGAPALFRHGDQWTLDELQGVADAFASCSMRLDRVLHGLLNDGRPGPPVGGEHPRGA
jgi:hypothetical protein